MSGIDNYLNGLPATQRKALQDLRRTIKLRAPDATERLSTNVPAFYYKGRYLVSFSATRHHLALLVMRGDIIELLADDLRSYATGSRIIRFTPETPLPVRLVEKIIDLRKAQIVTLKSDLAANVTTERNVLKHYAISAQATICGSDERSSAG